MRRLILPSLLLAVLFFGQSHFATTVWASDEAHAGAAHSEEPKPLMKFTADLAIWTLVTFVVYLVVLKKAAWGPLIAGLDQREATMKKALTDAEAARIKAEQMLVEHTRKLDKVQDEVKEILAEARRDAEHAKQEIVAAANKEAEATRKRAVDDIEHARDVAMKELFDFVSGKVILASEQVLGRALSGDDQNRLVQEALSQMGSKT